MQTSVKTLADLCEYIIDCEHKSAPTESEGHPLIRTVNIGQGRLFLDIADRVSDKTYVEWTKRKLPREGDLIIAREAPVGNVAIIPPNTKVCLGQRTVLIGPNNKLIEPKFLMYLLLSTSYQNTFRVLSAGATVPHLNVQDIRELKISEIPSLAEQKKIAHTLSTWDEAIEAVEELIQKKKTAKRALHQNIFSENSGDWKHQRMSSVASILDNKRIPLNSEQRARMLGNFPYYGANGLVDYVDNYIFDEDLILVAEDGGYFDEYKTRPIAYKISGKSWVNNHAHVLKVKEGFDYNFVFYSLEHKNILKFLNGGTRAKLNRGELEKLPVYFPRTYKEQKEIGNLFTLIDGEIELLGNKLKLLKKQKNGLMQRLLTGKAGIN